MQPRSVFWFLFYGAVVTAAGSSEVAARPRDEVMSGTYRCAVIGNPREWLDCFYGAAQPARAALGLAPALPQQVKLAASPPAGTPGEDDLGVRDSVITLASGCARLGNDRQWLDCYYAAARPMREMLHLPDTVQAGRALEADHPAVHSSSAREAALPNTRAEVRMAAYTFDKMGYFTVTLDNGKIWKQVDGDTTQAHWKKPPSSYVVEIKNGFLNSYNFTVKGSPGLFKVLPVS
jgi:hypothetical protein